MFYYSVNSKKKIVHFKGCHHLKNIKAKNLKSFENVYDVRKSEYRICSCCSPVLKQLRKEKSELLKYSMENGLSFFVQKGDLHICTHHSNWKVLVSNNESILELHHKNNYEKEYRDSVRGYHKQNYISDSILGYLEYINNHENYRMFCPLPVFIKKEPPVKGTKRWNRQQKAMKKKERKRQIWNVYNLIDSLSVSSCAAQA